MTKRPIFPRGGCPTRRLCVWGLSLSSLLRALCALCTLCVNSSLLSSPARAQNLDKPLQSIDEEVTAFSYGPDGRLAYAVYRRIKAKHFDALEHDDLWIQDTSGHRHRLLEGPKYTRGTQIFSYLTNSLRWSPNGRVLLAELFITTVNDESGPAEDSSQTMVFDDNGREIKINKGDNIILGASDPTTLSDNLTIAFLSEELKPRQLFSLKYTSPSVGKLSSPYEGRTFRDVAWLPRQNAAIGVEQDHTMHGPPRLQRLELTLDNAKELATLEGYEGGLTVSPSGRRVAYYIDKEVLEIRDLAALNRVARVRIGLGVFQWSLDENRLMLKRALEKKSGDLVWIDLPPLAATAPNQEIPVAQPTPVSILHGLSFREFAISPDGRNLAVVIPGKRNLLVFPLPR